MDIEKDKSNPVFFTLKTTPEKISLISKVKDFVLNTFTKRKRPNKSPDSSTHDSSFEEEKIFEEPDDKLRDYPIKKVMPNKHVHTTTIPIIPKPLVRKVITIIIIGITGAGKSSIINFLYVWSKGIKDVKDIKEVLISTKYLVGINGQTEVDSKNQTKSQTKKCTVYNFELIHEGVIYELRLMDTPGFGDTNGSNEDDNHIDVIINTVATTPELNSIVIMANGTEPRQSLHLEYCLQRIQGIIPDVLERNLILLLSNVATVPNAVLDLGFEIPENSQFYIDNSIFNVDFSKCNSQLIAKINASYNTLKETMGEFLKKVASMDVRETQEFKELSEERQMFRDEMNLIIRHIEQLQHQKESISQQIEYLEKLSEKKTELDLRKFMVKKNKVMKIVDTPDQYNTRCVVCNGNCHINCGIEETKEQGSENFKNCWIFSNQSNCKACGHDFTHHVHLRSISVEEEVEENVISEDIMEEINSTVDKSERIKMLVKGLDETRLKIENDIKEKSNDIKTIIGKLEKICSRFNFQREIDLVIEILKEKVAKGYQDKMFADKMIKKLRTFQKLIFEKKEEEEDL